MARLPMLALAAMMVASTSSAFLGALNQAPRARPRHATPAMAAPKTVKLGLVGGGTVGGGIVEILSRKAQFVETLGVKVEIARVVVGNVDKKRDWAVPAGCEITADPNAVLNDPDIDIVVEVMGGTTLAKEVVTKAIKAGKHVVTANKALIAADLPELKQLLTDTNAKREENVQFGFEAAVCGGIPIIHALQRDFLGDDIVQLSGIINGCTNFILSSMSLNGMSYRDALAEASQLGYAEADPTLDVGGFDARSKLRIMMKLAFGIDVVEDEIPCRGITDVTSTDFEYAALIGGTVKLLGIAKLDQADSSRISAFVSPVFVPSSSTLSNINGATNAVQISSTSLQSSVFVGQGAGRFPTANSCVSDILAIAMGDRSPPFPKVTSPSELKFVNSFSSAFYVRIRFRDGTGIIKQVGEVFASCGVSIYSILQNPIKDRNDAQFVVMTDPVDVSAIKQACVALEATDWCLGNTFYMPVL
jgi:homoserine dehydrogenase